MHFAANLVYTQTDNLQHSFNWLPDDWQCRNVTDGKTDINAHESITKSLYLQFST